MRLKNYNSSFISILIVICLTLGFITYYGHKAGASCYELFVPHFVYCPGCHKRITFRQDYIKQCPECGYVYHLYKSDIENE